VSRPGQAGHDDHSYGITEYLHLIVHHAISALTARASAAADLDPDRISFAQALRLIRRTATGTAAIPPCGLD
jgi:hypothetical protein